MSDYASASIFARRLLSEMPRQLVQLRAIKKLALKVYTDSAIRDEFLKICEDYKRYLHTSRIMTQICALNELYVLQQIRKEMPVKEAAKRARPVTAWEVPFGAISKRIMRGKRS